MKEAKHGEWIPVTERLPEDLTDAGAIQGGNIK